MREQFKDWVYSRYGKTFKERYMQNGMLIADGVALLMDDMVDYMEERLNEKT